MPGGTPCRTKSPLASLVTATTAGAVSTMRRAPGMPAIGLVVGSATRPATTYAVGTKIVSASLQPPASPASAIAHRVTHARHTHERAAVAAREALHVGLTSIVGRGSRKSR